MGSVPILSMPYSSVRYRDWGRGLHFAFAELFVRDQKERSLAVLPDSCQSGGDSFAGRPMAARILVGAPADAWWRYQR